MRFLWVQPIYQDSIHFIGAPGGRRTIEVSFFDVTHIADPEGDQGYERKLINDMHDMQSRINGEVFADENAATDGADVRPRPCTAPAPACRTRGLCVARLCSLLQELQLRSAGAVVVSTYCMHD